MAEEQSRFIPRQPSAEVKRFVTENPQAGWTDALGFVLDNYPQKEGEQVTWLVEGGAGVSLLRPEQRQEPEDIDILARTETFANNFDNSRRFDAKTVKFWFETRGLTYTPELEEYLFSSPTEVDFQGRKVLVMNPVILSASKQMHYVNRPARPKDIQDVRLLGVPPEQTQIAVQRLQGNLNKCE